MLIVQCPECETSFKVSMAQLQAANGQLQCGECQAVFFAEDLPEEVGSNSEEPRPGEIDLDAEIERERENAINVEPSSSFKERSSPASEEVRTEGLTRVGATAEDALPEAEDEQTDDLGRSSQSDQHETANTILDLEALSEDEVRLSDPALATEPGAENPAPNTRDLNEIGSSTVREEAQEDPDASLEAQAAASAASRGWVIPVLISLALLQCLYLFLV
jgi:predicted Zn finger-like uncharacterized protein